MGIVQKNSEARYAGEQRLNNQNTYAFVANLQGTINQYGDAAVKAVDWANPEEEDYRRTILVVDDMEINRQILCEILRDTYEVEQASDGYEALTALLSARRLPDMVLLDIEMPRVDGFKVLSAMKDNPMTAKIPVLFISANTSAETEITGLKLGAADYIAKPFVPETVRLRVDNCVALIKYRQMLEQEVVEMTGALAESSESMLEVLADMIEYRDRTTGQHAKRTRMLARMLLGEMMKDKRYSHELSEQQCRIIVKAVPLHDIGKISIPDSILLKPGKLTEAEFEVVKKHTVVGGEIVERIRDTCDAEYYRHCRNLCLYHHERWDGTGYPDGLKGTDIPLSARIMAVVDVYDALMSWRPYKKLHNHSEAVRIIMDGSGTHFDPDIVDILQQWKRIG